MKYDVRLSNRAQRDLDRVDRPTQKRVVERLELLSEDPYNARVSGWLEGHAGLRKSRLGGWRIIYQTLDDKRIIIVAMLERRGQVYKRI